MKFQTNGSQMYLVKTRQMKSTHCPNFLFPQSKLACVHVNHNNGKFGLRSHSVSPMFGVSKAAPQ